VFWVTRSLSGIRAKLTGAWSMLWNELELLLDKLEWGAWGLDTAGLGTLASSAGAFWGLGALGLGALDELLAELELLLNNPELGALAMG
jgi:hypothetical protein